MVRRHVGYLRLQTEQEVELLNELYDRLRLLVNFFYPSQKLISKTRQGAMRRSQPRIARAGLLEDRKDRLRRQFVVQREVVRSAPGAAAIQR